VPVFAGPGIELIQVDVHFPGEVGEYSDGGIFDLVVTVVSASYTPTSADVTLKIDQRFDGVSSSIKARGTHTMHTQVVGDTLSFSFQTSYEGRFFAAVDDGDDWEANATQDYDISGILERP